MRDALPRIRSAGADLAVVGNGTTRHAAAFGREFELDFPLLVDPELEAYRAAGLRRGMLRTLAPTTLVHALRAFTRGARQAAVQGDPWQLGGTFVIRPGGEVTFEQKSREAGDHPDLEAVIAAAAGRSRSV